jgi:hypothetical protein
MPNKEIKRAKSKRKKIKRAKSKRKKIKQTPYCMYQLANADGGDVEGEDGVLTFYSADDAVDYWENVLKEPLEQLYVLEFTWTASLDCSKPNPKWRKLAKVEMK